MELLSLIWIFSFFEVLSQVTLNYWAPSFHPPAGYMFHYYGIRSVLYLENSKHFNKDNLELQWPLWGSWNLPTFSILEEPINPMGPEFPHFNMACFL